MHVGENIDFRHWLKDIDVNQIKEDDGAMN